MNSKLAYKIYMLSETWPNKIFENEHEIRLFWDRDNLFEN